MSTALLTGLVTRISVSIAPAQLIARIGRNAPAEKTMLLTTSHLRPEIIANGRYQIWYHGR